MGKLHEWSKTWLVDFNPKKTKALVVSNTDIPDLNIKFDNENVEIVDNHKHLGVTFSNDGNWTTHIENIVNSAFKQVNVLRSEGPYFLIDQGLKNDQQVVLTLPEYPQNGMEVKLATLSNSEALKYADQHSADLSNSRLAFCYY